MGDKIDPIRYTENMRDAWQNDDQEAIEKMVEMHGDQPVTLKDLEEVFSHAISLLMTAYMGKDVIDDAKFKALLNTLRDEDVIDDNDYYNIIGEIEHLENRIKEGD